MKQKFIFLTILFAVVATTFISAQNDRTISIQGILREASGIAVEDGNYTLEFNIYHDPTNMDSKWNETHTDVPVKNGLYTVYLGEITAIPVAVFDTVNVAYVGVTIGGSEMTPRIKMTHAPFTYAAHSVTCSGAVGDVKYSILDPTQFAAQNGDCWVAMNGGDISGSALAAITGMTNSPDASGLFLRAHEYNEAYDNDRTTASPIATVQTEAFKEHDHYINLWTSYNTALNSSYTAKYFDNYPASHGAGGNGFQQAQNVSNRTINPSDTNHRHSVVGDTDMTGGTETRPDNLNLYIYIRIN